MGGNNHICGIIFSGKRINQNSYITSTTQNPFSTKKVTANIES